MRTGFLALVALLVMGGGALAEEVAEEEAAPDSWIGCWSRIYDAVHLAKHPGQKVSALTLSIAAREGESNDAPGAYRAKITALVRDKQERFSNLDGARCVDQGATLACFTDGFFLGRFSIERAGKNRKLALRNEGEHLALVPGVDLGAFMVLSPQNPEHTVFLLNQAAAKDCAR
jgi:hypothetical protein